MRRSHALIVYTVAAVMLIAGPLAAARKLRVVTSLPSLASIAESVGGDKVKVSSITKGVQDAHYVEAKPTYMVDLNRADLLLYSGLELEIGWLPLLIQGARNDQVGVGGIGNLNASRALPEHHILEKPTGEVDRSMGDVHPSGNPHYLVDPRNGALVAELVRDRLIKLDSDNEETYRRDHREFAAKLDEKIKNWEKAAEGLKGIEVVCYHPHWSYLLDWLGIKVAGYVEVRPGIPPTPRHKKMIGDLMKQRDIKVVIVSSWKEPTRAREVAESVGAKLVILPGEVNAMEGTEDYFAWIDTIVTKLAEAAPPAGQSGTE